MFPIVNLGVKISPNVNANIGSRNDAPLQRHRPTQVLAPFKDFCLDKKFVVTVLVLFLIFKVMVDIFRSLVSVVCARNRGR